MENKDKKLDRISRLQKLLDTHFKGKKDDLGKFLGYKDGAFVRQMLSGVRPVSEKTVDKINSFSKFKNWFVVDNQVLTHRAEEVASLENKQQNQDPLIQAVLDLMNKTDERGRLKIHLAAVDAFELHNSHISRTRTSAFDEEEVQLVESMRKATPMAKKVIKAAIKGTEKNDAHTTRKKAS